MSNFHAIPCLMPNATHIIYTFNYISQSNTVLFNQNKSKHKGLHNSNNKQL